MRVCFPGWFGPRHAGLGNELFPMAKAFIASAELKAKFLPTAWGLNDRGYGVYFGASRLDWVRHLVLSRALPAYTFREADYLATGEKDYDKAVRAFAEEKGLHRRKSYALMTDGLWGEFYAIRKARPFITKLLHGTRFTAENLYDVLARTAGAAVTVGVNIRMTDFAIPGPETDFRGLWNTRAPLGWYSNVCRNLRDALGDAVAFVLVTDGTAAELRDFIEEFRPVTTFDYRNAVVSNLLVLAGTDALVCSISSYSQWAAFLSDAPYFWYRPHLRPVDGRLTIWGSIGDPAGTPPALSGAEPAAHRGIAVGDGGELPTWLFDYLRLKADLGRVSLDLVRGGGVPESLCPSGHLG